MADQKISQLTLGDPAQTGDEVPIARSGANFKLTAQSIASLAIPTGSGNKVLATPSNGASGTAALRALVSDDIPALSASKITSGLAAVATSGSYSDLSGKPTIPTVGQATVTYSATPTFNASGVSGFSLTLTGNVTSSTFSNGVAGTIYVFKIVQDGSGNHTLVWPANVIGGATLYGTALLANEVIVQAFYFDGTNAYALGPGMVTP